jgi:hypothetical protein
MTYRGFVRGNCIYLEKSVELPDGTEVEVVVPPEDLPVGRAPSGSPAGALEVVDSPALCEPSDVDHLVEAIGSGMRAASYKAHLTAGSDEWPGQL